MKNTVFEWEIWYKVKMKKEEKKTKILAIETSCDETSIAVLKCSGKPENGDLDFEVSAHNIISQVEKHAEYGGVFPTLAKREHAKNLIPILKKTLEEVEYQGQTSAHEVKPQKPLPRSDLGKLEILFERELGMFKKFKKFVAETPVPDINAIAVTQGPGLEPALWVGLNFAKALALVWDKPLVPANHMEGHLLSVLINRKELLIPNIQFPTIALLISGGHTELVLMRGWMKYEILGQTRDDAIGEAFDKVARMLGLPYPGGPYISALAEMSRKNADCTQKVADIKFPRPMINSGDYDFSFSGLKTAVLYKIQEIKKTRKQENKSETLADETKAEIAREFEDAVVDVLVFKTKKALQEHSAKTLIIGGGVSANKRIREKMQSLALQMSQPPGGEETAEGGRVSAGGRANVNLLLPSPELSTDNAVMIAIAGYLRYINNPSTSLRARKKARSSNELRADGNLRL